MKYVHYKKGDKVIPAPNRKSSNDWLFIGDCVFEILHGGKYDIRDLITITIVKGSVKHKFTGYMYSRTYSITVWCNSIQFAESTSSSDNYKIF